MNHNPGDMKPLTTIEIRLLKKEKGKEAIVSGESVLNSLVSHGATASKRTKDNIVKRWVYILADPEKVGWDNEDYQWFNQKLSQQTDNIKKLTDWLRENAPKNGDEIVTSVKWKLSKKVPDFFPILFTKLKELFKKDAPRYIAGDFKPGTPFLKEKDTAKSRKKKSKSMRKANDALSEPNVNTTDAFFGDLNLNNNPLSNFNVYSVLDTNDSGTIAKPRSSRNFEWSLADDNDEYYFSGLGFDEGVASLQPIEKPMEKPMEKPPSNFPNIGKLPLVPKFASMNTKIRQTWQKDRSKISKALKGKLQGQNILILFSYDERKAVLANEKDENGTYYIQKETTCKHPKFPEPEEFKGRKLYYPLSEICWSPIVPVKTQEISEVQSWVTTLQYLESPLLVSMANRYLEILSKNEPKCSYENKVRQFDQINILGGSYGFGDELVTEGSQKFPIEESSASEQDKIIYCAAQAEYENKGGRKFGKFGELHLEHFYYRMAAVLYFSKTSMPGVTLPQYEILSEREGLTKLWSNGTTVIKATKKGTVLSETKFIDHLREKNLIPTTVYETENFIFTAQPQGEDLTKKNAVDLSGFLQQLKDFAAKGFYYADIKRGNFTKFTEKKQWTFPTVKEMKGLFPSEHFGNFSVYGTSTVTVQPGVYLIDLDAFQDCGVITKFQIFEDKFSQKTPFLKFGNKFLVTTYKHFMKALYHAVKGDEITLRQVNTIGVEYDDFVKGLKHAVRNTLWQNVAKVFFSEKDIDLTWWELVSIMLQRASGKEPDNDVVEAFKVEGYEPSSDEDDEEAVDLKIREQVSV